MWVFIHDSYIGNIKYYIKHKRNFYDITGVKGEYYRGLKISEVTNIEYRKFKYRGAWFN